MSFFALAVILAVAIVGTALASPRRVNLPVVVGELAMGLLLGATGFRILDASNSTFSFLAAVGFALVMFVAGTHVPAFNQMRKSDAIAGALRAVAIGALAVPVGLGIAHLFGTGHGALYAVLIASSSASLVLPALASVSLTAQPLRQLIPQIALADATTIILLPLVLQPDNVLRAGLGALAVIAASVIAFFALRFVVRRGYEKELRQWSKSKGLVLELRISLVVLLLIAALAQFAHVSIMLAGFALGLAVGTVGEPQRLAKQMFTITEGLFAPIFFVWFGASLNLRELGAHPQMLWLGIALGVSALIVHSVPVVSRQPITLAALTAAQMGVPVAAATIGTQAGVLQPGEDAALVLGALITVAATAVLARLVTSHAGADVETSAAQKMKGS